MKIRLSARLYLGTVLSLFSFLLPCATNAQSGTAEKPVALYAEIPFLQQQWPSVIAFRADFASVLTAAGRTQQFHEESLLVQIGDGDHQLPFRIQKESDVYRVLVQLPGAEKQSEIGIKIALRLQFAGLPAKAPALQGSENLLWNGDFSLLDQAGRPVGMHPAVRKEDFRLVEGTGGSRALAFNSTAEKKSAISLHGFEYPKAARWNIPSVFEQREARLTTISWSLTLMSIFSTVMEKVCRGRECSIHMLKTVMAGRKSV